MRNYGIGADAGELGCEPVHDCAGAFTGNSCGTCYVCHIRAVSREIWRVLRDDGTFFLNLGDSYTSGGRTSFGPHTGAKQQSNRGMNGTSDPSRAPQPRGLKQKDLVGIPWRVALALEADGWYLRSEIIWHKPNAMPESVTDRPTKTHEQVFLLTKSPAYFWDAQAIAEPSSSSQADGRRGDGASYAFRPTRQATHYGAKATRNSRSVWTIPTESVTGMHFATFPTALAERCIRAGTSEKGCCRFCGKAYVREEERRSISIQPKGVSIRGHSPSSLRAGKTNPQLGFAPACTCPDAAPVPRIVLDPFVGAGTTSLVARALGRHSVGLDLSYVYLQRQAQQRLGLTDLAAWEGKPQQIQEACVEGLPLFRKESPS